MPQFPNTGSAYGTWSLNEIRDARRGNNWPRMPFEIEYIIVGGGGGGSYNNTVGVGGPGGGFRTGVFTFQAPGTTYSITVGGGGAGRNPGGYAGGNSGGSSSFLGLTSGGGNVTGLNTSYAGTPTNFYNGGGWSGSGAGAGPGAGGVPLNGVPGPGVASTISGASYRYGAGGGRPDDRGGLDGGGPGSGSGIRGRNATANTGGGGGAGAHKYSQGGGSGGSGVVIIRSPYLLASTTGSPTVTTDGVYTIYTFTASGSITF